MKNTHSRKTRLAFTLIELLVVISIIAILAGLTFSGVGTALLAAKRVSARNDMSQIAMGVTSFYTEYGKYPCGSATSGTTDTVFGTKTADNSMIINVLRYNGKTGIGLDPGGENPRQIQFLQPKVITTGVTSSTATKGCVNGVTGNGNWYDPWGTQYLIFIDGAYDGDITVGNQFSDLVPNPAFGVGAASAGYYYVKSGTTMAVYADKVKYSDNRQSILLSWQ